MGCKSCKKKPANNITKLSEINTNDLEKAYNMVIRNASMTNEKWDFVEQVLEDMYPQRHPLNRGCPDCLRQAAKLIEYEYKKLRK